MEEYTLKTELTPSQRATPLNHTIDPGFVHHRKIETIVGPPGMAVIDKAIRALPEMPEWQKEVRIDHIYTHIMLAFCNKLGIRPLMDLLSVKEGKLFCSTENLAPCAEVYKKERVKSLWVPPKGWLQSESVEFHYSTNRISSDTLKGELASGAKLSIIAELFSAKKDKVIFHPIVMGSPWLEEGDTKPDFDIMWFGYDYFENYIEDFDEFKKVLDIPEPKTPEPMQKVSEKAFKLCLASILGDNVPKDWGGETSDYLATHLHLNGRRVKAAFLLKGPARFEPMTLKHLGSKGDQIVRLSREPVDVLIVQHCHDITSPVRETIRAFSVQPSNPRRFCLIDGRDSLRLLQAYNLYSKALELSAK